MKNFVAKQVPVNELLSITCDVCKKSYNRKDDCLEFQEIVQFTFETGYGSVFGDLNKVELDMCQHCFKEKLGDFIKITENDWK